MPRFKTPAYGLKMTPVDFDRQVIPGSFEHALCHLIDHEIDLAPLVACCHNDTSAASVFASAVQRRQALTRTACPKIGFFYTVVRPLHHLVAEGETP